MKITSKASIAVTAALSAAEVLAAVADVPGVLLAIAEVPCVREAVLAAAQGEAIKDASGMTFVSRDVSLSGDGARVELVYEKADPVMADVGEGSGATSTPDQPPAEQSGPHIPSA